jgi:hypothetical protein
MHTNSAPGLITKTQSIATHSRTASGLKWVGWKKCHSPQENVLVGLASPITKLIVPREGHPCEDSCLHFINSGLDAKSVLKSYAHSNCPLMSQLKSGLERCNKYSLIANALRIKISSRSLFHHTGTRKLSSDLRLGN